MPSDSFRDCDRSRKGKGKKLISWLEFSADQASSRIEFDDGTVLTKCDQCRQIYGERNPPGTPPCESCRVELAEENVGVARLYMMVEGQVLTRSNGQYDVATDLNHLAVWAAIDAFEFNDRLPIFELVLRIFHKRLRDKAKKDE